MSIPTSLQNLLKQQGEIPFVEFMHHALYDPHEGYYSAGLAKFGPQGDFITAPELSPLFGQTLANQCQPFLKEIKDPVIFEFGAGSGRLCIDILQHLEKLGCLPTRYFILEVSSNLRHRQQQLIDQQIPHLAHQVEWLQQWPTSVMNGVIIANEVIDAMPIHRFFKTPTLLTESYIKLNAQGEAIEIFKTCTNPRLLTYVQTQLPSLAAPYQSEVNLLVEDWLKQCSIMLGQGAMFIIDYGFPRHEFYHPDRHQGTLMCHYRHHTHPNPLLNIGEQDITAHVDFTQVAEAAEAAHFHVAGYTNQASFLLANGLLSLVEMIDNERDRIKAQQAIKQFVQPQEMGELFKVIALTKNWQLPLQGFLLHDKRVNL